MKLVLQTKVIARTMDSKYVEWAVREHKLSLNNKEYLDIDSIERQVHQWACRNEKHHMNYHEHVETWYVIPEV